MKSIWIKFGSCLRPASPAALKLLQQYQHGDEILIEHKRKRSAGNHRRFFEFVAITFDWQDEYPNAEIWRKVLEIAAGHFDQVIDRHGHVHYWPKSIAWDELDEDAFQDLFSRVVNAYLARYGKTLSQEQIDMVVSF